MYIWSALIGAIISLSVHQVFSADGCGSTIKVSEGTDYRYSVRCGDMCTGRKARHCTCGRGSKRFNAYDNTTWCCNGSECKMNEEGDITCKYGTPIPLTTPCNGKCNTGKSFYGGRQYWTCDNKDQCIKIQHWADKIHHCMDRSDERKRPEDVYSPIQWDQMTTCGNTSDRPGVKCNGWCMPYYHWCNELSVMKCRELGGRTTVHKEVCSNNTFWTGLPCRYYSNEGKRCSSGYSGQCYFARPQKSKIWRFLLKTCKDGSHDIFPFPSTGSCPPSYFPCLVNNTQSCVAAALKCDLHPQEHSGHSSTAVPA